MKRHGSFVLVVTVGLVAGLVQSSVVVVDAPLCRLVMACTVRKADEKFVVEAATLMMVNREWIPVDNRFERVVADALVTGERSFLKVMRYGAPEKHAYANFVLRDTDEPQLKLDIVVDGKGSNATAAQEAAIAGRPAGSWVWRTSQTLHMPPLPPPAKPRRFQASTPADPSAAATPPAPAPSTTAPNESPEPVT
jgi:hypothetical protein